MTTEKSLQGFPLQDPVPLPACPGWPRDALHYFDRRQVIALLAARAVDRPLLVRGEPGSGKTQLARATAQVLRMPLAVLVVNERTETEDLFWQYDALRRLSDANDPSTGVADEKTYLSAGPLWWALNPVSAYKHKGRRSAAPYMGVKDEQRSFDNGVLLLIDEIDKADRAVPNSLLEALGNYSFDVPYLGKRIDCGRHKPLIIITTNNEQALPPAFERRCLTLDLSLPDKPEDEQRFVALLEQRGKGLFGDRMHNQEIFAEVARQIWNKRQQLKKAGESRRPGLAEYLDHLEAILAIRRYHPRTDEMAASKELAELTYEKYGTR